MRNWVIQIINQFGYAGILILIAVENIFPPIPSEIILIFAGFMTNHTEMNVWGVIMVSVAGSLIGALILYEMGCLLNRERLVLLLKSKPAKKIHFKEEYFFAAIEKFSENGIIAVFFCRFIPIIRSLISIPAGMTNMNVFKFMFLTFLGTFIWNGLLVHLGALAGESWDKILIYIKDYYIILPVLIVITAVLIIYIKRQKKYKKN